MIQPRTNFTFFWHGPFSQWSMHYPIVIDGITYCCNEQYMMAEKARLFNDQESLQKIMASDNPKTQKQLGRCVSNFNQSKWDAHCKEIVFKANLAKFQQHNRLRSMLLNTKNTIIAEASPFDTVWGIGMNESHPDVCDVEKWKGTNWLGEALMKVRSELRK